MIFLAFLFLFSFFWQPAKALRFYFLLFFILYGAEEIPDFIDGTPL